MGADGGEDLGLRGIKRRNLHRYVYHNLRCAPLSSHLLSMPRFFELAIILCFAFCSAARYPLFPRSHCAVFIFPSTVYLKLRGHKPEYPRLLVARLMLMASLVLVVLCTAFAIKNF